MGGGRHLLHLLRRSDGQLLRRPDLSGDPQVRGCEYNVARFSTVLRHEGAIQGSLKGAGHETLDCIMSLEVGETTRLEHEV